MLIGCINKKWRCTDYGDETGFNLYTRRAYGRAKQGERLNGVVGGYLGSNVTVVVAISD